MVKVLLINSNRFRHPWPVIPFGLVSIATNLEKSGEHKVKFLDLCFSGNCEEDIKKSIRNFHPDIIGISIRNIDDTGGYHVHFLLQDVKNDVVDHCKREFHGPIVIGGPSVGISGREMLEYFDLEYAIRGDGEAVMPEFARCIETQQPLEGLEGLVIRREGRIIQDGEPARIIDLDTLPFPKPVRYLNLNSYRRFGSPLHIQTKRGCAFSCSYCTYNKIEGKKYRLRSPELVAREIDLLVGETGINHIEFTDSVFNVPLDHAKEVLREIIKLNLNLRLHTMGLTPSAIDGELISLMKRAGFNEADIGADSACEEILDNLGKSFGYSEILRASEILKKEKMPVTWFIILGAPAETRATVMQSLNNIGKIAAGRDLVFVSTGIRVYNGAPVSCDIVNQNGNYPDNFLKPVKIDPESISLDEIHAIAKEFSFRFPNFYFYEKNNIIPGWLLITGNLLLKIFHSHQPVWKLLILLRRMEKISGITLIKKILNPAVKKSSENSGFTTTSYKMHSQI
jgi:hypothetical protein